MSQLPVTQFGAPDAPFCDLATARVTIIPAPLEYSVCYMKGIERGPQAILDASSHMELYDEELGWYTIEIGVHTRPALDYRGMDHAAALQATGCAAREFPPDLTVVHIDAHGDLRDEYEDSKSSHASIERRVIDFYAER